MTPAYQQLIADFCQAAGLNSPDHVARGTAIEVDGTFLSLAPGGGDDAQHLLLYADFGAPPDNEATHDAYQALLQQNYLIFPQGGAFTLSPASGNVIYIQRITIDAYTGQQLANVMAYLAGKATEWRRNRVVAAHQRRGAESGDGAAKHRPGARSQALVGGRSGFDAAQPMRTARFADLKGGPDL
jgi:hypothetical protein